MRKKAVRPYRPVSVWLPEDLAHQALVAAATQNRGRSPLICDALTEYLERHNLVPHTHHATKEATHVAHPG